MYFLIIVAIFSLALGTYVLTKGVGKTLNRLFFWLTIFSTLWILTNVLAGLVGTIFWIKSAYAFGAFVPAAALMWVLYLSGLKIKFFYFYLIGCLGLFFFILPYVDGLVLLKIDAVFLGGFIGKFGPLFPLYAFYQTAMFLSMWFVSYISYKNSSIGLKREQFKYVFIGVVLTCLLIFIVSFLLPLFDIIRFTFLDSPSLVIFLSFITYAITRFRLFNIKSFITRSILYAVLVASVASFFAFSIFWLAPKFGGDTRNGRIISTILSSILIVVFLDPIKRVFAKLTDAIFYKDKIDYSQVLQKASSIVSKEIDLQKLLHELALLLSKELKLKKVKIFLPVNNKFVLTASSSSHNQTVVLADHIMKYFVDKKSIVITEELFNQRDEESDKNLQASIDHVTQELENIGSEMTIPIIETGQINALFVLSQKMSGDIFGTDDINFFNLLAPQIATAIEKSRLYEEVQELNLDLQKKVDERTESLRKANLDLEDRNKYLTTMQVVVNMISRTLDLKQVTQMIANSIAAELGYIGGVLSFVNADNKMRVKAVTENKQAKETIALLPKDIFHYEADLKGGYNFGVDTVLTAKINFSEHMTDFFSPPVDKNIIEAIQEKLGVKTIVGVPIFSEDRIIGVVHFLLSVEREKISPLDIEMMTSLTSQVGIVSRNLALYENLQKVNYDLNDANLHLKALDKAKSEFLSIASHQLRTPVSALKGYLSMMMEGDFGPLPEKINKLIGDLFESASRLARTINVFLNVSRIEAGRMKLEKKPMQISDLVNSVMTELASAAANKNIKLSYEVDKQSLPLVYADSDKLREVILNLVDNAIKYTPQGGIVVKTLTQGNILEFSSQDTGVGIDPAEAQALFRKFVRGDGAAQINTGGSGLGLFIAQKIVKEHEGNIWVESAGKGKGSVFKFTVPLATKEQIAEINKVDK
jgi:signal transduction histidine kinase